MPLKTLFLNPPSFENFDGGASSRWPATREIESYWYPVWLAYPAGMLEGARLLDANPHHISWPQVVEILKDYEFLVLFTSTIAWTGDQQWAQKVKDTYPNIKICFVGPPVTTDPDKALNECPALDFVCRREFDYSVVEYANGKPLDEILGISYRKNGQVVHNPDRPQIEDLDALPWVTDVYKRDLDVTKYNVPFLLHPFVSLYSTRGCPAQCTFCLWPQTTQRTRLAQALHRRRRRRNGPRQGELWPDVKEFFFDDDTFNIQKARTIELCAKLKPLKLTWSCTSRVTTDYDTLKAMREAGCRLLIVGFESGDPQILKNIKKGATVERARDFARDCHKLGLTIHGDFILGLPGETKESIRNTIDFAKQLDVETIQVSVAHAFPGTELYEYARVNGFITNGNKMTDDAGPPDRPHRIPRPARRLRARDGPPLLRRVLLPSQSRVARGEQGHRERRRQAALSGIEVVPEDPFAAHQAGPRRARPESRRRSQRPSVSERKTSAKRARISKGAKDEFRGLLAEFLPAAFRCRSSLVFRSLFCCRFVSLFARCSLSPMTHSTMTFRRYLVLAVITLTASCGDTFLSRGMKSLGPVSLAHPGAADPRHLLSLGRRRASCCSSDSSPPTSPRSPGPTSPTSSPPARSATSS